MNVRNGEFLIESNPELLPNGKFKGFCFCFLSWVKHTWMEIKNKKCLQLIIQGSIAACGKIKMAGACVDYVLLGLDDYGLFYPSF